VKTTHIMSNAPTLMDQSGAFDATVDSIPGRDQTVTLESSTVRTTVLPQVEHTGDAVTLVSASRPRFQEKRALGEGGIGEVVAAFDQDIGREVAIKRLRPGMQGPSSVARFVDEIRTVGALEHPNIVPIHDVGVNEDGSLYFVMRCVQGQTLESIIEKLVAGDALAHEQWTFERRVHVFRQLLDAVAFAHERGYVHRDIKPANLMAAYRGGHHDVAKLLDFGLVKTLSENDSPHVSQEGFVVGSPLYMAPEQIMRTSLPDRRTDIYGLGAVAYFMLTGRAPFVADNAMAVMIAHARDPVTPPSQIRPEIPADLERVVLRCLAKIPDDRYPDTTALADALESCADALSWSPEIATAWWRANSSLGADENIEVSVPRSEPLPANDRDSSRTLQSATRRRIM
jgi:serine/threonine protein kinase